MSLKNRVAVITGATGGLGSFLARQLAGQGMNLALLSSHDDTLAALAESLHLPESRVFTRTVDLLDLPETVSAAQATAAHFGRVDALLHVVGGWTGGKTLVETHVEDLAFMLNRHVWTSFNVVKAFVPHLVGNGWGRVVMISSPYAARPNAGGGPYAIGKAGQEALILTLSQELKGSGVTANLLQARSIDMKREKVSASSADHASWTTPEELLASILYLLSEQAGAVNGARIPLFGSF